MQVINKRIIVIFICLGIISFSLFKLFYKKETVLDEVKLDIINSQKENSLAIMLQNEDGSYKESTDFSIDGYHYNKNKSQCIGIDGNIIENVLSYDYEANKVVVDTTESVNCYLYFDSNLFTKDLSGNNYDAVFKNGASIVYDEEEGQTALFFDGNDDYADVADLPATIDWNSGFTVIFEAKWKALNRWSRIFDFGNEVVSGEASSNGAGNDNIFICNRSTTNTLNIDARYDKHSRGSTDLTNGIDLDKKMEIKTVLIKNTNSYEQRIYKNGQLETTNTYNVTDYVRNVLRTSNYLGRSNWEIDSYFNGYIYNLKIIDSHNNIILWYDFA